MDKSVDREIKQQIKSDRINKTIGSLRDQLTATVDEAAGYRKNVSTAKTNVKRMFYVKKLKKIQTRVIDMLVAINRLESINTTDETAGAAPVENNNAQ